MNLNEAFKEFLQSGLKKTGNWDYEKDRPKEEWFEAVFIAPIREPAISIPYPDPRKGEHLTVEMIEEAAKKHFND